MPEIDRILVTGAAGFIGFHLCERLLSEGRQVTGLDIFNDYYDPALKEARSAILEKHNGFRMVREDMADREAMKKLFMAEKFHGVVNLAAQAGVRYSLINPHSYADTNLLGFVNILEGCRHSGVNHLVLEP